MLFRKKHPRDCRYCAHSTMMDDDTVLCVKRGVRSADKACRKFTYDPCKRTPSRPQALDFGKYQEEDFSL